MHWYNVQITTICEYQYVKKNIYYSLLYSHLVYAIVWGSACISEINKISVLKKRSLTIITCNDIFSNLSNKLEILKVQDVFKLQVSKIIFNCLQVSMFFDALQFSWVFFNLRCICPTKQQNVLHYQTKGVQRCTTVYKGVQGCTTVYCYVTHYNNSSR